jgi:hypothetical protein
MIPVFWIEPVAANQIVEGIEFAKEAVRNADLPRVVLQLLPASDDL